MALDLQEFLETEHPAQADWATECIGGFIRAILSDRERQIWPAALGGFRAEIVERIKSGDARSETAGSLLFVADAIESAHEVVAGSLPFAVASFAMQLSLTDAQWAEFLQALAKDRPDQPPAKGDQTPLRLAGFADAVLAYMARRGERETIRRIYFRIRDRIEGLARTTISAPTDFVSWRLALAVLVAHLTERRRVPLTVPVSDSQGGGEIVIAADGSGGQFIPPPEVDHPALAQLFSPEEIKMLHRREAYAAECFAHLFSAVFGGYVTEERQAELHAEFARQATVNRLDAKQSLLLMKTRFEAAPWLS